MMKGFFLCRMMVADWERELERKKILEKWKRMDEMIRVVEKKKGLTKRLDDVEDIDP